METSPDNKFVMTRIFDLFSIEGVDGEVVVAFFVIIVTSSVFVFKCMKQLKQTLEENQRDASLLVQPPQPSYNRSEEPCPVCFGSINFAVETDCFHLFCGTCLLGLIQYARHRTFNCPVCRTRVAMLYPVFSVDEYGHDRQTDLGHTRDNLISEIQEYNILFSVRNRTLLQTVFELPVFVRRLWRSFNNPNDIVVQNRMKTLLYIIMFAVASYILFPNDLFPEVHFGILGFLDDFLVLTVSLIYLTSVYRSLFFNLETPHG
ncbi:E3 ubiquitin-protein ligase RNF170-like [Macrosteles quadrilineatus]|uniref:E3 ubiquitin-protein ligase RNF170-like n=1 Tax=Macrosteles quadrilineatus TaxID=74068 RepID=UPI0023E20295|nr:E3 ubiquitin-protein ligase RNF170-like [Macrosteles quadrilineatus]